MLEFLGDLVPACRPPMTLPTRAARGGGGDGPQHRGHKGCSAWCATHSVAQQSSGSPLTKGQIPPIFVGSTLPIAPHSLASTAQLAPPRVPVTRAPTHNEPWFTCAPCARRPRLRPPLIQLPLLSRQQHGTPVGEGWALGRTGASALRCSAGIGKGTNRWGSGCSSFLGD